MSFDVQIVFLKEFEHAPGSRSKPGEVVAFNQAIAERLVSDGVACYYADFKQTMLEDSGEVQEQEAPKGKRQSRVKNAPKGVDE